MKTFLNSFGLTVCSIVGFFLITVSAVAFANPFYWMGATVLAFIGFVLICLAVRCFQNLFVKM